MIIFVGGGGGQREGFGGHILPKTPKIALISECLAADSSPDASADALAIINIRATPPANALAYSHLVSLCCLHFEFVFLFRVSFWLASIIWSFSSNIEMIT